MNVEIPPSPLRRNSRIEEMRALWQGANLEEVATRTIEIEVSYSNFEEYWASQTGLANTTVQAIRKMSDREVSNLQTYLREHLPINRDGRIAYPARANAVKGRVPS